MQVFLEMPVPSQGHYGFHSFPVVDWFCLFIYLWVLTFPLEDCAEFGNIVITLMYLIKDIQETRRVHVIRYLRFVVIFSAMCISHICWLQHI